ncbi:MAG TPA: hypothetical protein VGK48_04250 [Terriglobia bacterium]|jgi:hypothetical protein
MLRKPAFWIVFAVISAAAAVFTFKYFSTAFPLVSIDLQMNRKDALDAARALAQKNAWPPQMFSQAAEFSTDQETQNFIELEGGGKPELSRILKQKIFAPYTWVVRHFKEGDAHETQIRFTPEGQPYDFSVKLPDQEKGASISASDARKIAENTARADWNIDFSKYQLAESSKDDKPGGRTDHAFVYERQDERLGAGRYRLRLVVGGDRLTGLTQYVQIPEAFTRRYEQMRAANDAINAGSSIAVFGPYLLGFCGIGLFWMIRRHWVLWRQPIVWGLFISLLMGLQELNAWPLSWMKYDTATSAGSFELRQLMNAVAVFGAYALLLTISFMAAETLSRRAFPRHVQLWKAWSKRAAPSPTVLGETVTGYLLVAPFFAYEIVLYFFAQGKLGWWTPSDSLVNPDMFANYVPSLSAISQAAQAGFWEECFFRAIPLSIAALIGNRFGKRRAFIAIAMIVQALVFASGHAGYANEPSYARVVELIIPSFVFGTLFLLFGLLPGIVLHFAYDTTWMALPLFVASGTRAHVEQAVVVAAVLVPLWVVLANRARAGKWLEVPENVFNGAWQPREVPAAARPEPIAEPARTAISPAVWRAAPIAGLAGLVIWILASPFHTDATTIRISRVEAIQKAREALSQRGVQLPNSWTVLSEVEAQPGEINRFVWQTAGPDHYRKLLSVYVTPPTWFIRFARFEGDVAERAEEYQVYVDGSGHILRVDHNLPEAQPGKNLTQNEARMIALNALGDPAFFTEVSADAGKRPARTDWTFVFKDTRDYGLPQGEPRVSIEVDGDRIVDTARYVYVPEEWSRQERSRQTLPNILGTLSTVILIAILATAAVVGVVQWSRGHKFSPRTFFAVFATVVIVGAVNTLNSWPLVASQAVTTQPLALQVGIAIAGSLVFNLFSGLGLGLAAGLVAARIGTSPELAAQNRRRPVLIGISVGLCMAGAGALARQAAPVLVPAWGNLAAASMAVPLAGASLAPLTSFFSQALLLLSLIYTLKQWPRANWIWIVAGLALAGASGIETIVSWLILGAVTAIVLLIFYALVFRHAPELLIITVAALSILSTLRDGFQRASPAGLPGSIIAAIVIGIVSGVWYSSSRRQPPAPLTFQS